MHTMTDLKQRRIPGLPMLLWLLLFSAALPYSASPALASDPICTNPVTAAENMICDDEYLQGLEFQINNVVYHWIAWRTGQLDEALQFRSANHHIAREECGGNFRCLESEMRGFLDEMHTYYLEDSDTIYTDYVGVPFAVFQSEASHGNDMLVWNDPQNFGWTERLCQLRCAAEDRCIAAAFDPMQAGDGKPGLCVLKHKVELPLQPWTSTGTFSLKR